MSADKQAQRQSTSSLTAPDIPESQLTRLDPDSILADDADPNGVLDEETESEAGGTSARQSSKRTSAASAIFNHTSDQHVDDGPKTPDMNTLTHSVFSAVETPKPAQSSRDTIKKLEERILDLTTQVTGLNSKLVSSFERMSDLEDEISASHERIHTMSTKIAELEKERTEHLDALNTGLLVEKAHVSNEMQRMMDKVIEETAQRGKAENDKQCIEAELDELSSSLFNEANKMVAVERLARARAEEKSRQMEQSLKDTEGIMLEQQKVLADLQRQVETHQLESHSLNETDSVLAVGQGSMLLHPSTLHRSPSQRTVAHPSNVFVGVNLGSEARLLVNIVPYQEFKAFVAHLKKLRRQLAPFYNYPCPGPAGRTSDPVTSPANGTPTPRSPSPALGPTANSHQSVVAFAGAAAYSQGYAISAATSPFVTAGVGRHRDYPLLPSNVENLVHLPSQLSLPFLKRSQEEDVEPCLRLDFAPGLNWLSRRQANTAILEGNLVIEPIFPGGKLIDEDAIRRENAHLAPAACSLCGIPVVNVPLPGVVAASHITAEQGSKTSLVPSSIASATSSWATSAANSLREVTSGSISGTKDGTTSSLTTKSSRPSLFSSFRRSASLSKASVISQQQTEPDSPPTANQDESDATGLQASPMPRPVDAPVPTHIFRISETATTRYLLCPHHCLVRLRAACQFWGFLRNMERSVVLEGKFAFDDQPVTSGHVVNASENVDVVSRDKEPEGNNHDGSEQEGSNPQAQDVQSKSESSQDTSEEKACFDSEPEPVKESNQGERKDDDDDAAVVDPLDSSNTNHIPAAGEKGQTPTNPVDGLVSDDEGFADARSSPAAEKPKELEEVEENPPNDSDEALADEQDDNNDTPLAGSFSQLDENTQQDNQPERGQTTETNSVAEDSTETQQLSSKNAKDDSSQTLASSITTLPPPVPPRSAARGPAPPLLQKRTGKVDEDAKVEIGPRQSSNVTTSDATTVVEPPVKPTKWAISLLDEDSLEWEDKMWTEITKLKEQLWKARIGLLTDPDFQVY